jgi:hypothetical protein
MPVDTREKRSLQAVVAVVGLVPVSAGLLGALYGGAGLGQIVGAALDSHIRYLSGLLLAIGLAYWSAIPDIEKEGGRIGLLTLLVVVGGFCRALGMLIDGWPGPVMAAALGIELVIAPTVYLWQRRLAHRAAMDAVQPWR